MILSGIVLILLCLFIYFNKYFKVDGLKPWVFPSLFLLKVLFAVIVWYYYYYIAGYKNDSDMYLYFNEANAIFNKLKFKNSEILKIVLGLPTQDETKQILSATCGWNKSVDYGIINDNRIMFKVNLLIRFFSYGIFWIHLILFTFCAFFGLFNTLKGLELIFKNQKRLIILSIFILPSSLIWLGGIYKESLLIFCIGGLFYSISKISILKKIDFKSAFLFMLYLVLLLTSKPLYSFCFLFAFMVFLFTKNSSSRIIFKNYNITFFLLLTLSMTVLVINDSYSNSTKTSIKNGESFNFAKLLSFKQEDFLNDAKVEGANTFSQTIVLDGSYRTIAIGVPDALINSFLLPINYRLNRIEILPFLVESILIIILLVLSVIFPFHVEEINLKHLLFYFSFLVLIALGLLIPIIGLTIKYRSVIIPFLFGISALAIDWDKIFPSIKLKTLFNSKKRN